MQERSEYIKIDKNSNRSFNDIRHFTLIPKDLSINTNAKCDDNIISTSTTIDDISQINTHQSTHTSWRLFRESKMLLNQYHSKSTLIKQNLSHQIHRSISLSDCIDWTNHPSDLSSIESTIHNQLDTISFLQEYLQHEDHDVLIDLLQKIVREINHHSYKTSAMNNNHFHVSSTFHPHLQLSNNNNKEKKDKGKKESNEVKSKKETENETTSKKAKKKSKKIEETITTTDSELLINSSTRSPRSPSETIGYPSLSIPVIHSNGSSTIDPISPDPSPVHIPHPSNIAHLSQVQQQLQNDLQNSSLTKPNQSIQQQLQSLSQMARDGDEVLITLSVNALTQKQHTVNNNHIQPNQGSIQTNPYFPQPLATSSIMPRNLEIVAKGFARVPQPTMYPYNQLVSRYPLSCYPNHNLPQTPIGPPIRPIFTPPNLMMSNGFIRPPTNVNFPPNLRYDFDDTHQHSHCDYLCQSSLYQPDFRGRPSPGLMANPYFPVKTSSTKHKRKTKVQPTENMNRTYSAIY